MSLNRDPMQPGVPTYHDLIPGPHVCDGKVSRVSVLQAVLLDRPHTLVLAAPRVDLRTHVTSQDILSEHLPLRRAEGGEHSGFNADGSAGTNSTRGRSSTAANELRLGGVRSDRGARIPMLKRGSRLPSTLS